MYHHKVSFRPGLKIDYYHKIFLFNCGLYKEYLPSYKGSHCSCICYCPGWLLCIICIGLLETINFMCILHQGIFKWKMKKLSEEKKRLFYVDMWKGTYRYHTNLQDIMYKERKKIFLIENNYRLICATSLLKIVKLY